jgi:hypothetical protein
MTCGVFVFPQGKLFCYPAPPCRVLVSAPIKLRSASHVSEITGMCRPNLRCYTSRKHFRELQI